MACETSLQDFLDSLRLDPENGRCVDCDVLDPEYASISHGSLICENCFNQHSAMPNNLSRPVNLLSYTWSPQDKLYFTQGGNSKLREFLSIYSIPAELSLRQKYLTPAARYYREHLMCLVEGRQNLLQRPGPSEGFSISSSHLRKLDTDTLIKARYVMESVKNFFYRIYRNTVDLGNRIEHKLERDVGQNQKLMQLESELKPKMDAIAKTGSSVLSSISSGIFKACSAVYSFSGRNKDASKTAETELVPIKKPEYIIPRIPTKNKIKIRRASKQERMKWNEIDYPTSPIRLYDLEKYHTTPPKMPSELIEETSPIKLETRSFNEMVSYGQGKMMNTGKDMDQMKGMTGKHIHFGTEQVKNTLKQKQTERALAGRKENIDPVIKKEETVYETYEGKEKKLVTEKTYYRKSGKIDIYRDVKYQPVTLTEKEYKAITQPTHKQHIPTRTQKLKHRKAYENPEGVSLESSSESSLREKYEKPYSGYKSESSELSESIAEERHSIEVIQPKIQKLREIAARKLHSISPERRVVEHEYPIEKHKKKHRKPLKEKVYKEQPEKYEYYEEPTYIEPHYKPAKTHKIKEKAHKLVHPQEREYETYEYPTQVHAVSNGSGLEKTHRKKGMKSPERYRTEYPVKETYYTRPEEYESPEEYEHRGITHIKVHTQEYKPPGKYEHKPEKLKKKHVKEYESPEEYAHKPEKLKKKYIKEYESTEEYEHKPEKLKKKHIKEYKPTSKQTPKIITHGEALPPAEYKKSKKQKQKQKQKKQLYVVHEPTSPTYREHPVEHSPPSRPQVIHREPLPLQESISKPYTTEIETKSSPLKVQTVSTTDFITNPSEEVIITKPVESKPVVSTSTQPTIPKTRPTSETVRKYYRPVPGKDDIKEEIIERRIIYKEPITHVVK